MLKKMNRLMFIFFILTCSVSASAGANQAIQIKSNVPMLKLITVQTIHNLSTLFEKKPTIVLLETNQSTIPDNGWMLFLGLVGFVLLSNRTRI